MSVRALQYSGGWGRQSQERPVSARALQDSGGWGRLYCRARTLTGLS